MSLLVTIPPFDFAFDPQEAYVLSLSTPLFHVLASSRSHDHDWGTTKAFALRLLPQSSLVLPHTRPEATELGMITCYIISEYFKPKNTQCQALLLLWSLTLDARRGLRQGVQGVGAASVQAPVGGLETTETTCL